MDCLPKRKKPGGTSGSSGKYPSVSILVFLGSCILRVSYLMCFLLGLHGLGGNLDSSAAGVYLHLVFRDNLLRLYVGQANNLRQRIGQHNSPAVRRNVPSLHYAALDGSDWDQFVVLAYLLPSLKVTAITATGTNREDLDQLSLNVMEMWACCIFHACPPRRWRDTSRRGRSRWHISISTWPRLSSEAGQILQESGPLWWMPRIR